MAAKPGSSSTRRHFACRLDTMSVWQWVGVSPMRAVPACTSPAWVWRCADHPAPNEESVIVIKKPGFFARTQDAPSNDWDIELLRSELFSIEQLKHHAMTLAGRHEIDTASGRDRLLPRLADNARVLFVAYDVVTAAATLYEHCVRAIRHGLRHLLTNPPLNPATTKAMCPGCARTAANIRMWRFGRQWHLP